MISLRRVQRMTNALLLTALITIATASVSIGQAPAKAPAVASQLRTGTTRAATWTIPALMISDIHFDPFHDPAKVPQLAAAPVSQWKTILGTPSSADQPQAFASLQKTCNTRGVDTPYELLQSSLQAMHAQQPDAKFITVSGDLIAHLFSCRYKTLLPRTSPSDLEGFAEKTIAYVVGELHASFPGIPVYMALGNNDSGCGDYKLDSNGAFLAETAKSITSILPEAQRQDALKQFEVTGSYSVTMAAPMRNTRIIVINDIFLSSKYSACNGLPNLAAGDAEIDWLKAQFAAAQQAHQKVWVLGHIPPGVNAFTTVASGKNICAKAKPDMFLSSDALLDTLVQNGSSIRLGIFAHTHMDELRLLESSPSDSQAPTQGDVVIKMVPSISPVDGNYPSFTIARVDPASATLEDYHVVSASNQTGIYATWTTEYDYARAYHQKDFSAASVKGLIAGFGSDPDATQPASQLYIHDFFVGDRSLELSPFWPLYECGLANNTAKSFSACVCSQRK